MLGNESNLSIFDNNWLYFELHFNIQTKYTILFKDPFVDKSYICFHFSRKIKINL